MHITMGVGSEPDLPIWCSLGGDSHNGQQVPCQPWEVVQCLLKQ